MRDHVRVLATLFIAASCTGVFAACTSGGGGPGAPESPVVGKNGEDLTGGVIPWVLPSPTPQAPASPTCARPEAPLTDAKAIRQLADGCVLTDRGVNCWNMNAKPCGLQAPSQIAVQGSTGGCALGSVGIQCWGYNPAGYTPGTVTVPDTVGATKMAISNYALYYIKNGRVIRKDQFESTSGQPPEVTNAVDVAAGYKLVCAATPQGVVCRGEESSYGRPGGWTAPVVGNATQVIMTDSSVAAVCALIDGKVSCWSSWQREHEKFQVPAAINESAPFVQLAANNDVACALNSQGLVKCWGPKLAKYATPEDLVRVKQIAVVQSQMCAVTDQAVRCWGDLEKDRRLSQALPRDVQVLHTQFPILQTNEGVRALDDQRNLAPNEALTQLATQMGVAATDKFDSIVAVGLHVASPICGLAKGRVGCLNVSSLPTDLGEVTQLIGNGSFFCAVSTTSGARCWSVNTEKNKDILDVPRVARTATRLFLNGNSGWTTGDRFVGSICASIVDGITCWGSTKFADRLLDILRPVRNAIDVKSITRTTDVCLLANEQVTCYYQEYRYSSTNPESSGNVILRREMEGRFKALASLVPTESLRTGLCGLKTDGQFVCWNQATLPTPVARLGHALGTVEAVWSSQTVDFENTCVLTTEFGLRCLGGAAEWNGLSNLLPVDLLKLPALQEGLRQ